MPRLPAGTPRGQSRRLGQIGARAGGRRRWRGGPWQPSVQTRAGPHLALLRKDPEASGLPNGRARVRLRGITRVSAADAVSTPTLEAPPSAGSTSPPCAQR
jgi:hypothetical protein